MRTMREEAPDWIFPWKRRGEPWLPKAIALAFAVTAFTALITMVRIRTAAPNPWGQPKASVIHVLNDAVGRSLALRARENGPSPVRFQPGDWPVVAALEAEAMRVLSHPDSVPYQPRLRDLAAEEPESPRLVTPGAVVMPPLESVVSPTPLAPPPGPARPVIEPLAGLSPEDVPQELAAYGGPIVPAMLAEPARFLIQIDRNGRIVECIGLTGGDAAEAMAALESWLRGVTLLSGPAPESRWAALQVRFINPPR